MRIMVLSHTSLREYDPETERRRDDELTSYASPGTTVERHYPEDLGGVGALHQLRKGKSLAGLHHILETPALVKKIIEAERSGFDAVVQSNTFDPGIEAARLAVRIPVVGPLRSSCHFAACLCDRFAFIVPLDSYVPYVFRIMDSYRMGRFVTGIKAINMYGTGDLSAQHDLILEHTVSVARDLVADGAQAIIPLGGRLFPDAVSPNELEQEIGVPVINTKAVTIRFAELMVTSKITHSQKAYPWSPGLTPEDVSSRSNR